MEKVFVATELPPEAKAQLDELEADVTYWTPPTPFAPITTEQLCAQAADANVLVSAVNVPVTEDYLKVAAKLELIANIGDGYDNIATKVAKEHHIAVTNAPTRDSIASTAEQTFALALALSRQIVVGDQMMREDKFPGWRVTGYLGGHQVYGKKFTIVGLGRIGKVLAQMLSGFDVSVNYVDPIKAPAQFEEQYGLKRVSLEKGLAEADYVTLNCTLNQTSQMMIDAEALRLMKPSAYLINCARGGIVDEAALLDALENGEIAGAAIDTPEHEPHVDPKLAALPNVVVTPHAGNATYEARVEMSLDATGNVVRFLTGKSLHYQVV